VEHHFESAGIAERLAAGKIVGVQQSDDVSPLSIGAT
jgi:hypothetical protein